MFLLFVIIPYLLLVGLVLYGCRKRFGTGFVGISSIGILMLFAPFWDSFIAKGIMTSFSLHHSPLQEIVRTVEKPESVLWLDESRPGFNKNRRFDIVSSYLDGVHLKMIAVNGDDGKIYLYRASLDDFAESEMLRPEHERLRKIIMKLEKQAKEIYQNGGDNKKLWRTIREDYEPQIDKLGYLSLRKKEVKHIFTKTEIYKNKDALPKMNYLVVLQRKPLPFWQNQFALCDEITIEDVTKGEKIAFSKRCLGCKPRFVKHFFGKGQSSYDGAHVGDELVYSFDDKVLFNYAEKGIGSRY